MNIKTISILKGLATYVPGIHGFTSKYTGGTDSARYCYSVWLRHLTMAYKNGISNIPNTVAELGPGDSLGIGLAALISGVNKYYAFDIVEYANTKINIEIFEKLVDLFNEKENIPDEVEFPKLKPYLESYEFPKHILTDKCLDEALKTKRIELIRNLLLAPGGRNEGNIELSYFVPWYDSKVIREESIDMIYSQAVLEHVNDLAYTYEALNRWLKPGGIMSHQVDFKSHGIAKVWNGHWTCSDFVWTLIKGKKPYIINRLPHSVHINLLRKFNFEVICDIKIKDTSGIQMKHLTPRFRNINYDDLVTSGAFIQAVKKVT